MKNGDWVLIDEINLASNDVLQKIVPLVEGKSLLLYEKGDLTHV
jgi:midasin